MVWTYSSTWGQSGHEGNYFHGQSYLSILLNMHSNPDENITKAQVKCIIGIISNISRYITSFSCFDRNNSE